VRFAQEGDPGWPSYDSTEAVMVFDDPPTVVSGGYQSARALR
jgi:hypothetical protein